MNFYVPSYILISMYMPPIQGLLKQAYNKYLAVDNIEKISGVSYAFVSCIKLYVGI